MIVFMLIYTSFVSEALINDDYPLFFFFKTKKFPLKHTKTKFKKKKTKNSRNPIGVSRKDLLSITEQYVRFR